MTLKKKLIMGSATAAMGLSLVAGGTWAAFNDVEQTSNTIAAGTLELSASGDYLDLDLGNLKPGDHFTRQVRFDNDGSLAIKEVLMAIEDVDFVDYEPDVDMAGYDDEDTWGENNVVEYLNQFHVTIMNVGAEGGGPYPINTIVKDVKLGDFYLASGSIMGDTAKLAEINGTLASGQSSFTQNDINNARASVWGNVDQDYVDVDSARMNVTSEKNDPYYGLPVNPNDFDILEIKVEFYDDETKDGDVYVQNKYQGDSANLKLSFEARQWDGQEITEDDQDGNGYVETNERANNGDDF